MNRKTLAVCIVLSAAGSPAWARDPGPIDVRGRPSVVARTPDRTGPSQPAAEFNPVEIDIDELHGGRRPAPPRAPRRRLYEEVEEAVDRGAGRVEDDQAYDARQAQADRDERLGRIPPRREAERVEEETDRRRRVEQHAERERRKARETEGELVAEATDQGTEADDPPDPGGSALARFVAQQEALLNAARERYERDLAQAEAERDAALAVARSRAKRAAARRAFEERRSALTVEYQRYRSVILGTERPSEKP